MLLAVDLALAVWVAGWIALGIVVGEEVEGLRQLSGTVEHVGSAVQHTGALLRNAESVPVLGSQLGGLAGEVERSGASAVASAASSRQSVDRLSWELALAIALIPSTPVFGLYLPLRLGMIRERRGLRRLWGARRADPRIHRLLAERALSTLPYHRLVHVAGANPWAELEHGHYDALMDAEFRRLGLTAPSAVSSGDGAAAGPPESR
jgi:hypothetical protein